MDLSRSPKSVNLALLQDCKETLRRAESFLAELRVMRFIVLKVDGSSLSFECTVTCKILHLVARDLIIFSCYQNRRIGGSTVC